MLYNYGAAILRAVGDTKRPLIFLIISGVVNAGSEYDPCDRISPGCSRCCHCNCDLTADFLRPGTAVSVSGHRRSYQLRFSKLKINTDLSETDFSGGHSGGYPEYGDQFLKCAAAVFRQFFWFYCNGRIYGSQQYFWIPVYVCELCDTGVYELYQPELWCAQV